ncbi:MAG: N-acetyl-gamma-glutamyl-phosphate reductase [Actinomycetota bacterium]
MAGLRAGVLGASGFTGGELVRLLLEHPEVDLAFIGGRDSAGRTLEDVHLHLAGSRAGSMRIQPVEDARDLEVAFLALPHGESSRIAPALLEASVRVIDLAGDFRLPAAAYPEWYGFEHPSAAWLEKAVYGLPERFREQLCGAQLVANPGCFPTPVVLGLAPLLERALVEGPVVVDGKTGLSGAGRTAGEASTHVATEESIRPYRFPSHQHTPEMEHALALATGVNVRVAFAPHLVPAVRGVLTTCYVKASGGTTTDALVSALAEAYEGEPFVRVLPSGAMADTKRVRGSNVVELQASVDPRSGTAAIVGALDNLVKGAAGQAIQNLNLVAGFDEAMALTSIGLYP